MNILIVESALQDRALVIGGNLKLALGNIASNIYFFRDDKNTWQEIILPNGKISADYADFSDVSKVPEYFDIVFRHATNKSPTESKFVIVYGGNGISESRGPLAPHEMLLSLHIGVMDATRKLFTSEVAGSIVACFLDRQIPCRYLITQEQLHGIEYTLRERYVDWSKNTLQQSVASGLNAKNVHIILNSVVFKDINRTANRKEWVNSIFNRLLQQLFPEFYFNCILFDKQEHFIDEVTSGNKAPFACIITAETSDSEMSKLTAFQGIETGVKIRSDGYKGFIFIATMCNGSEWEDMKSASALSSRGFLDSNYTYTLFLNSLELITSIEKKELEEIRETALYSMSDEMLRRVKHSAIDAPGIISGLLHKYADKDISDSNTKSVLQTIIEQITTLVLVENLDYWKQLQNKILEDTQNGITKLSQLFLPYRDIIVDLCLTSKPETEVQKIGILFVDDNGIEVKRFIDHFVDLSRSRFYRIFFADSVPKAIEILEKDKKGILLESEGIIEIERETISLKCPPGCINVVVTDWLFFRMENGSQTLRLSLQQGVDLTYYIKENCISVEVIALTNRPKTYFEEFKNNVIKDIYFLEKSVDVKLLEYQIKMIADEALKSLFEVREPYNSWHHVTSESRAKYELWIYYQLYRRSADYFVNEKKIASVVRFFIDVYKNGRNKNENDIRRELEKLSVNVESPGAHFKYFNVEIRMGKTDPREHSDTFRDKLLARRILLSLVKVKLINTDAQLQNCLIKTETSPNLKLIFNQNLFLGSELADVKNAVEGDGKNLLPEERAWLNLLD